MAASNNQLASNIQNEERSVERPPLVVIAGPTTVGKTALGIALALAFHGEVVNADSRYLYRGFDIGVAKPTPGERQGVPHHLIDVLPPDGEMSLARYQDLAMTAIAGIHARNRVPLLVGGTPLYINAVVEGWHIPRVPPHPELRAALEAEANEIGIPALSERLRAVDPVAAARCGTNPRRIIRALEIYQTTGIPMSAQEGKGPPPFETLEIGLTMPRPALYQAIDNRVTDQIERGLVAEVRALVEAGIASHAPAMSSLGYRQLLPYLSGEVTLDEAIDRIRFDTHRYVRHQETWLRRNPRLVLFDVTENGWQETVTKRVQAFLENPSASVAASTGVPPASL
jgi:tRNA dimethylallyltransferase